MSCRKGSSIEKKRSQKSFKYLSMFCYPRLCVIYEYYPRYILLNRFSCLGNFRRESCLYCMLIWFIIECIIIWLKDIWVTNKTIKYHSRLIQNQKLLRIDYIDLINWSGNNITSKIMSSRMVVYVYV